MSSDAEKHIRDNTLKNKSKVGVIFDTIPLKFAENNDVGEMLIGGL